MKRIGLHLAFWSIYLIQDVLLIFLVNVTRLQHPSWSNLPLALSNALILLLPKLAFTYFMLCINLKKLSSSAPQSSAIGTSVLALFGAVLLHREATVHLVNPYIYHWNDGQALFYPLGLLVALMDIGFVSGAAIVIWQLRSQAKAREREDQLLKEKLQSEIKFLRNQVNPHFLFNTLNNIYALARKKSDQTPEVILKLSKLMRFMLYESGRPRISIGEEIRILDDYIELERLRFNNRVTVNFYREIDNDKEEIAPLLLLPFVENAFKHGPGESHFEAYIHIDLVLQKGRLTFSIENTREGSDSDQQEEGIGLKNVKRQLDLIYQDYSLKISKKDTLFKVALFINLESNEKD